MTRKIAKGTLSLLLLFYFIFLNLFALGDLFYPDRVGLFSGDRVESILCFSYREEEGKIVAFGSIPIKELNVSYYEDKKLLLGGELLGIRMETSGLLVTGIDTVKTDKGPLSPAAEAGLKKGDVLLKANGVALESASAFSKILAKSEGKQIRLDLLREEKAETLFLTPVCGSDPPGYRAGIWVRDGAAGLGTLTYVDPESLAFAGLGHPVCDSDTALPFPFGSGTVCQATVESIAKGDKGAPGQLRGSLAPTRIGSLSANCPSGVYGVMDASARLGGRLLSLGLKDSVKTGPATLVCTLDSGGKQEYKIEIEEIAGKDRPSKNFILRITDPALLEKTGGIVQGMSGSPIIQNGRLIGAVTHVLVDDPTRGYGIFIENMLETAQSVANEQLKEAS